VRRENFTADVLRRLAGTPKEQIQEDLFNDTITYKARPSPFNSVPLGTSITTGGSWGKSSVTLSGSAGTF